MLYIRFIPKQVQDPKLIDATKAYKQIWSTDSKRIVDTIEKITNLKYKENSITATIHCDNPRSKPLLLTCKKFKYKEIGKRASLIHELSHIILSENNVDTNMVGENKLESHKILDLVLYDIWDSIYGEAFAEKALEIEKSYFEKTYKKAWEWALSFTKEERAEKFRELK